MRPMRIPVLPASEYLKEEEPCRAFHNAGILLQSSRVGSVFNTSTALGRFDTASSLRIFPITENHHPFSQNCAMSCSCVTITIV